MVTAYMMVEEDQLTVPCRSFNYISRVFFDQLFIHASSNSRREVTDRSNYFKAGIAGMLLFEGALTAMVRALTVCALLKYLMR